MVKRVLIVGGGSAGFLTAMTLGRRLPGVSVTLMRSPEIQTIGVGEGTTVAVPRHLHEYLGIDLKSFYTAVHPTWKLGIRYLWGSRPFFDYPVGLPQMMIKWDFLSKHSGYYVDRNNFEHCSVVASLMSQKRLMMRTPQGRVACPTYTAYQIEYSKFLPFLEKTAVEFGVTIIDDTVVEVRQDEKGITGLVCGSGQTRTADLYVDCSGFRSLLLGKTLEEPFISFYPNLRCNRAMVGMWERTDERIQPYITAETMNHGWCWQIEHVSKIIRGYVHGADYATPEEIEREFREKNPKLGDTRTIKFPSGRYKRSWVKNVVAIGNASGFVEPLESTALATICDGARYVASILSDMDGVITPTAIESFNNIIAGSWDHIHRFLSVHYKFNTRLDTPFWQDCRRETDLGSGQQFVDFYVENGPSTFGSRTTLAMDDSFGLEGYLTMLIGQCVPHRGTFVPSEREKSLYESMRHHNRLCASEALTVEDSLRAVHSPAFDWDAMWRQITDPNLAVSGGGGMGTSQLSVRPPVQTRQHQSISHKPLAGNVVPHMQGRGFPR